MHVMRTIRSMLCAVALLGLAILPEPGAAQATGAVAGQVVITRGRRLKKDRSNVVIVVQGIPDSAPTPSETPVVIDQTDKTFHPRITVIPTGTTVDFPNNDRVFHNVFSVSRATTFDLGLYKAGSSKSVEFDRAGVIDIYCNIHPQMSAKVLVVDTVHYAVTGPDGSFTLPDVPPGIHPFMAWQADGESFEGTVEVEAGKTSRLTIQLKEDRWSRDRHTRKDGTPYGRYK